MGIILGKPVSWKNITLVFGLAAMLGGGTTSVAQSCAAKLTNSDVSICLQNIGPVPRIAAISAGKQLDLNNASGESLPATVEVNGANIPVQWKLQPRLGNADAGHVVFVYEAADPHLRLRWVWESRASSGAMEHYIEVENLSAKELWLPMVDSLRLAIRYGAGASLEHVYVEKGANTPSKQGTHTEAMAIAGPASHPPMLFLSRVSRAKLFLLSLCLNEQGHNAVGMRESNSAGARGFRWQEVAMN
jgi:hypothetical protein